MNGSAAPEAGKDSNPSPEDFAHGVGPSLSPKEESWAKDPSQKMGIVPEEQSWQQPDLNTL